MIYIYIILYNYIYIYIYEVYESYRVLRLYIYIYIVDTRSHVRRWFRAVEVFFEYERECQYFEQMAQITSAQMQAANAAAP